MNKKGLATYDMFHIIIFTIFVGLFTVNLVMFFDAKSNDISTIPSFTHEQILISRILYSPSCFMYYDQTSGRTITGMIDINKFTQERFEGCMLSRDPKITMKLSLTKNNEILETLGAPDFIKKTKSYRKELYNVNVKDRNDNIINAELIIEIQNDKYKTSNSVMEKVLGVI